MLSGVCFDILDPYLIRVIKMLDGFTTGPTYKFYIAQHKKLYIFCLDSYVAEKWEEAEYVSGLSILSGNSFDLGGSHVIWFSSVQSHWGEDIFFLWSRHRYDVVCLFFWLC